VNISITVDKSHVAPQFHNVTHKLGTVVRRFM